MIDYCPSCSEISFFMDKELVFYGKFTTKDDGAIYEWCLACGCLLNFITTEEVEDETTDRESVGFSNEAGSKYTGLSFF